MPAAFLMLLMAICPVFSFSPVEVDYLAGGLGESTLYKSNLLGVMGTKLGWAFLLTFGVAGYPLALLMFVSSLRRLLWRRKFKPISWEYLLSFPLFGMGLAMLFGIWPGAFSPFTDALNLCTLPGGVIGQKLSSPEGFLTLIMNGTGAAIVSVVLMAIPLAVIWYFDWKELFAAISPAVALPSRQPKQASPKQQPPHESQIMQEALEPKPEPSTVKAQADKPLRQAIPEQPSRRPSKTKDGFVYPDINLLDIYDDSARLGANAMEIERNARLLQQTLDDFRIDARVVSQITAPQVTQFEIMPASGVRLNTITALESNIKMALAAKSLRILAPIPGKNMVGIQVPNESPSIVPVRNLMLDSSWKNGKEQIPLLLGKNINGKNIILDLAKAPHLLIAGTTGSGKSVCMNLLITSMLFKFSPDELRLIMVDPKVVEFAAYARLPHLVVPVINDVNQVALALRWAINEMERRYRVLAKVKVRNLEDFNKRPKSSEQMLDDEGNPIPDKMPFIVVIIDELADIMSVAKKEVETSLQRIAAKSRAVGIHTIIATQRPDTKVITGTIKANYPVRIAFRVASHIDSQTIMGQKGAESLLGNGDMLFQPPGAGTIERIQCGMASDNERNRVVDFVSDQAEQHFDETVFVDAADLDGQSNGELPPQSPSGAGTANDGEALIQKAIQVILESRRPTVSFLQRSLGIGYNKAASIMDELEKRKVVGPQIGTAQRQILINSANGDSSGDGDDGFN
ncbi:MAG: DNA translocase FtsK 4TM domain-containing protein [Victivallales bacterium]|nr:DNA translocase FtsK 4TM domain-containing protein [Victivallales bacterium]